MCQRLQRGTFSGSGAGPTWPETPVEPSAKPVDAVPEQDEGGDDR